jgi:hypothetical protein
MRTFTTSIGTVANSPAYVTEGRIKAKQMRFAASEGRPMLRRARLSYLLTAAAPNAAKQEEHPWVIGFQRHLPQNAEMFA